MPPGGKILVEHGAKLIIDGGLVTSYHPKTYWQGVELVGDIYAPSLPIYQGSLEMKNGAVIERARMAIKNYSETYYDDGGGIINVSNSHFYNCSRYVNLHHYPFYSYATSATTSNCSFDNVTFETDDIGVYPNPIIPDAFVSSWNTKGVLFKNCLFDHSILLSALPQDNRGKGFNTFGTGMLLYNNTFKGFSRGIYSIGYSGTPTRTVQLYNNTFNGISENINLSVDVYGDVMGNTISNMARFPDNSESYGIYLDHPVVTDVRCYNRITGVLNFSLEAELGRIGVLVNNATQGFSRIYKNEFFNLGRGLQAQLNNPRIDVICNLHEKNYHGWNVSSSGFGSSYVFQNQGTGCNPSTQTRAGNIFRNNVRDITCGLFNHFYYQAFSTTGYTEELPVGYGNVVVQNCSMPSHSSDPNSQCGDWCLLYVGFYSDWGSMMSEYDELMARGDEGAANVMMGRIIREFNGRDDARGLQAFLEKQETELAQKLLIPLYIEQEQYAKAQVILNKLRTPQKEKQAYQDYYGVLMEMQRSKRNIFSLLPGELQTIRRIAADSFQVSAYAKGLLEWAYNEPWIHPIDPVPLETWSAPVGDDTPGDALKESQMNAAMPNPATGQTTIRLYLTQEDAVRKPALVLRNAAGAIVFQQGLKEGANEVTIQTAGWQPGLYLYSLTLDNRDKITRKLTVVQ